jgi:hypothetical protein
MGPAGGSNSVRIVVEDGTFLPKDLSPATVTKIWKQDACKLHAILKPEFRNVDVRQCRSQDGTPHTGFCFLSMSKGTRLIQRDLRAFTSANLNRMVDDRCLVSAEMQNRRNVRQAYWHSGGVRRAARILRGGVQGGETAAKRPPLIRRCTATASISKREIGKGI